MHVFVQDLARGAFTYAPPTAGQLSRAMEVDRRFADLGVGLVDGSVVALAESRKNLKRPVLIIQGHQDPIGDKTAEDVRAVIAGATLVYIRRCGHFPWIEQPEAFRKAIAEFLSTTPQ